MMTNYLQQATQAFFQGEQPEHHIFSPYSLCPIGAHVDHQHGLVTGLALDKGIDLLFSGTDDGQVEMASTMFSGRIKFNVKQQVGGLEYNWGDYLRGALWAMQQKHPLERGLRGIIAGSMPSGGIASSAALLCGLLMALAKVNHLELTRGEIVKLSSMVERQYIGLSNGVLDQSCVTLCRKNQLLFLDTDTLEYKLIPFGGIDRPDAELPFKVAIFYSGVTRSLTNTDYNIRVEECETAARILHAYEDSNTELDENILRRVSADTFEQYATTMPPRFARRARHFFTECERVENGIAAWEEGDIEEFGEMMFESCESSILNYECGSQQLISIFRSLRNCEGVYGARFCGAGFIGSCFALIDPEQEGQIHEQLARDYLQQFPMYRSSARSFVCSSHGGVGFIE